MNIDPSEIAKFDAMAAKWWDKTGPCRPLHDLNPVRLDFILQRAALEDRRALDIGCGAGILSEAMAQMGATVTGIDASEKLIKVAQIHSKNNGLAIDYHHSTIEAFSPTVSAPFPVVVCMEMLEHVPEPWTMLEKVSELISPGGDLFVSTLNRTPEAFFKAIVAAEYVLNLLPRGTHHYRDFIRPSELAAWGRQAGLSLQSVQGMHYNPFTHSAYEVESVSVNYLAHFKKGA